MDENTYTLHITETQRSKILNGLALDRANADREIAKLIEGPIKSMALNFRDEIEDLMDLIQQARPNPRVREQ